MGTTNGCSREQWNGEQNVPCVDRLSALPDAILCHILSFLTTKSSMATSILARRWRFLWTHVPNLHLDITNIDPTLDLSDIIDRVLLLHDVKSINKFDLLYTGYCTEYQIKAWITAAVARNVKSFELYIEFDRAYGLEVDLPQCLLTCKTLVNLKLCCYMGIPIASVLPNLKTLHLIYFKSDSNVSLPDLLSGCPVLEKLCIGICESWDLSDKLNISSPTVKSIGIQNYGRKDENQCMVEINTPALKYLYVSLADHISAVELKSLIAADIDLFHPTFVEDSTDFIISVLKFVDSLCNVRILDLSLLRMKFVDATLADPRFSIPTRRFGNLVELNLKAHGAFLRKLLEAADNLEVLTFSEVEEGDENYWEEPQKVPTCLTTRLKSVTFSAKFLENNEFEIVRYLLGNAKVLARMEVRCRTGDLQAKFDALLKISRFKRESRACELDFVRCCLVDAN